MNQEVLNCPSCKSDLICPIGNGIYCCPDCGYEGDPQIENSDNNESTFVVKDAYGNTLNDGDTIMVIKDLPVKVASKPIKSGTKVKNIKLVEGDHNISCKIEGFGAMALKSEFVKKV